MDINTVKAHLNEILVPRIPASPGHDKVRDYITDTLQQLGWSVSIDKFRARVPQPFGTLTFENIIATPNPKSERFLIYAAHYDSKWFADDPGFVAATDSAVSCAMLLAIAKALGPQSSNDLNIMFVFFDGEEAIQQWTAQDSIYGARHLANAWDKQSILPRIDMLVLLDLIGAPDPKFYNFFANTGAHFQRLMDIETKLGNSRLLSPVWQKPQSYMQGFSLFGDSGIEDDHIPFLRRGVPILHCIVYPFPEVNSFKL